MRWWACDRGHAVEIPHDAPDVYMARCPRCSTAEYKVETHRAEDNPRRLVPAPKADA